MSKIYNEFIRTIEDYRYFINDVKSEQIERIKSNLKKLSDFIEANNDAIIEGIDINKDVNRFYEQYSNTLGGNPEVHMNLNSNLGVYEFCGDRLFIIKSVSYNDCITAICRYNGIGRKLSQSYYVSLAGRGFLHIESNMNIFSKNELTFTDQQLTLFTSTFFDTLEKNNFVSIENDLLIKLEQFKAIITKLTNK